MAKQTDGFERAWASGPSRLGRSALLVATLFGGVVLIEAGRQGFLGDFSDDIPRVHLAAIAWVVTLLLIYEIVEMVLSLGRSVADSVGRHLQVYALLLLRDAFSELRHFPEPIVISSAEFHLLGVMGADTAGAIALFASATFFLRLQRHTQVVSEPTSSRHFVEVKKSVALLLLVALAGLCIVDVHALLWGDRAHRLFDRFFTILVFVDVLFAVVSMAFTDKPPIVFRNFGFAFAAIVLRLAVASPEFVRPALGVSAALIAVLVTLAYNFALREPSAAEKRAAVEKQDRTTGADGAAATR